MFARILVACIPFSLIRAAGRLFPLRGRDRSAAHLRNERRAQSHRSWRARSIILTARGL